MPWDQWRVDLNEKVDRFSEEHLQKLRQMRGNATHGSAAPDEPHTPSGPRTLPPLAGSGVFGAGPGPVARVASAGTGASATPPTQLHFSQFTDADKHAFFAMLDEYFGRRTESDLWLDDPCEGKSALPVGHGLSSYVVKVPFRASRLVDEHGGVPGWLCIKQVDIDEENAPHSVRDELALLQRLRHPHLVGLLAAFTQMPDAFTTVYHLVLPLYPVVLSSLLEDQRFVPGPAPFERDERTPWLALFHQRTFAAVVDTAMHELLGALAYLHEEHVAHRDIKPANILFDHRGRVQLIDLGVAWAPGRDEGASRPADRAWISEVGTGAYRAPELLFAPREGYNAYQADMWSYGAVFANMLTGWERARAEAEDEEWGEANQVTAWEQALWPRAPPVRAVRETVQRKTLFDASRGDIGLAGDLFQVLGLPESTDTWPEAALFQPALDHFPFVRPDAPHGLLSRLPYLSTLSTLPDEAAAVYAVGDTWLPQLLALSAQQRPTAHALLAAWPH